MAFKTVRGLNGKVYVPGPAKEGSRKHPCKDCYSCQFCSDDRCRICRDGHNFRQCQKKDKPKFNGSRQSMIARGTRSDNR